MMNAVTTDETAEVWRPLGFAGEDAVPYDTLVDGVPSWMTQSFWNWVQVKVTLTKRYSSGNSYTYVNHELVREIERVCRVACGYNGKDLHDGVAALRRAFEAQDRSLRLADFLLSRTRSGDSDLDRILLESGSAWRVGVRAGRPGLVRRVPEGVQVAVDRIVATGQRAGVRLAEAWGSAFGPDPDPSRAYLLAVKAVEDAAIPVVASSDASATLGKVLSIMKAQEGWSLPATRQHPSATGSAVLLGMLQMLWTGQSDRHGGRDEHSVPITQAAAEAAVLLAVPLVQWFTSGAVSRTP